MLLQVHLPKVKAHWTRRSKSTKDPLPKPPEAGLQDVPASEGLPSDYKWDVLSTNRRPELCPKALLLEDIFGCVHHFACFGVRGRLSNSETGKPLLIELFLLMGPVLAEQLHVLVLNELDDEGKWLHWNPLLMQLFQHLKTHKPTGASVGFCCVAN